ncbi:unnamed protein product, partial [Meganyctiphanes norvegica]
MAVFENIQTFNVTLRGDTTDHIEHIHESIRLSEINLQLLSFFQKLNIFSYICKKEITLASFLISSTFFTNLPTYHKKKLKNILIVRPNGKFNLFTAFLIHKYSRRTNFVPFSINPLLPDIFSNFEKTLKLGKCMNQVSEPDCIVKEEKRTLSLTDCSKNWMTQHLDNKENLPCLNNFPEKVLSSCGNGILEYGEQCDCGPEKYCQNSCCNAALCLLNYDSQCDSGLCCDVNTCQHKSNDTVCRPASGTSDLPEHCSGLSNTCPTDVHKTTESSTSLTIGLAISFMIVVALVIFLVFFLKSRKKKELHLGDHLPQLPGPDMGNRH